MFKFLFWAQLFLVVVTYGNDESRADLFKKGRPVPALVSIYSDIVLVLVLTAYGHFVMAIAWLIQIGIEEAIFSEPYPSKSNQSNPTAETKE